MFIIAYFSHLQHKIQIIGTYTQKETRNTQKGDCRRFNNGEEVTGGELGERGYNPDCCWSDESPSTLHNCGPRRMKGDAYPDDDSELPLIPPGGKNATLLDVVRLDETPDIAL